MGNKLIDAKYLKDNFSDYKKDKITLKFSENKKLKSCIRCDGTGMITTRELSDYHRREYDESYKKCETCDGDGRVVETRIYISVGEVPYNSDANVTRESLNNILFETRITPFSHDPIKHANEHMGYTSFSLDLNDIEYTKWS